MRKIGNKTILLVDDESTILDMFKFMFEMEGFNCLIAREAITALSLAKENRPDIILSDLNMPDVNGFDFRRLLISENELSQIPFALLTSNSQEDNMIKGYNLTIVDYIQKTLSHKIILEKVKAILRSLENEKEKNISNLKEAVKYTNETLIPEFPISFKNYELSKLFKPYNQISGGDFIDIIPIDENKTIIVLGDVMGKEWEAWFLSVAFVNYIRSTIRNEIEYSNNLSPANVLNRVNKILVKDIMISEIFISISIVLLDDNSRTIKYSGACDLPALLRKGINSEIFEYKTNGINLGFMEESDYEDILINVNKGDTLFLYSDAVIETTDSNDKQFGYSRFKKMIKKNGSNDEVLNKISSKLNNYSNGKICDDLTLVVIKRIND